MPSLEEKPLTIDTTTSPTSTSASQQSPLFSPALSGVRHLLVGLDESEHSIEALKFAFTGNGQGCFIHRIKAVFLDIS